MFMSELQWVHHCNSDINSQSEDELSKCRWGLYEGFWEALRAGNPNAKACFRAEDLDSKFEARTLVKFTADVEFLVRPDVFFLMQKSR